jgi:DNA-binding CsgD family transcriptional regulator
VVVFIFAYLAAVVLAALTIGGAFFLVRKDRRRRHQALLLFVIVNDLVSLADILFRYRPASAGPWMGGGAARLEGFLTFPLMGLFSVLAVAALFELADRAFPKALKNAFLAYWGLLFAGFLAAEYRSLAFQDERLTHVLMPFFNAAIMASGLGASLYVLVWGGAAGARRSVRLYGAYFLAAFILFGALFFLPLGFKPGTLILVRGLFGLAYLLPPLLFLILGLRATAAVPLTRLGNDPGAADAWFEKAGLSARESEIVRRVLEGQSNTAIGAELFIGRRTVESHLYNIYRKLGVKNRLQLARRAASESAPRAGSKPA